MSLIGSIEHFDPINGDINSYIERLEQLFIVNDINEKKVALLITFVGPQTYDILKNLVLPSKANDKTYDQLVVILRTHFAPKKNIIAERFKFYKRDQNHEETVNMYIVELKKLSANCDFGHFLNDALRDRLVCGLHNEAIQRRLLTELNPNFTDVCQIALGMELANEECKAIQPGVVNVVNNKGKGSFNQSRGKSRNASSTSTNYTKSSSSREPQSSGPSNNCHRCGRWHSPSACPAIQWTCFACNKMGHTAKMCSSNKRRVNGVEDQEEDIQTGDGEKETNEPDFFDVGHLGVIGKMDEPVKVKLIVQNKLLEMEIDSGACRTVMAQVHFKEIYPNEKLVKTSCKLKVVTGQPVKPVGQVMVTIKGRSQCYTLPIVVIESEQNFIPLLGRNWLDVLSPGWRQNLEDKLSTGKVKSDRLGAIEKVNVVSLEKQLKQEFSVVFTKDSKAHIKYYMADLKLKDNTTPIFHKAYSMPFALKGKVERELLSMVEAGILVEVKHSEWASPIVVVPKKNNEIRVCVDFKVTLNQVIQIEHYPLPCIQDIFSSLSGATVFTVLDLSGAYQQLRVNESSKPLLTINTHMGLFRYTRLTFGISSAPAIFQSVMDRVLGGLPLVFCYLDDVLIGGANILECKEKVREVLKRLADHDIRVNVDKCKFFQNSVDYLGHVIDANGIHPTQEKVKAVLEAPPPTNVTQLKSYLGLLNFYGKFLPMLSSALRPLYRLQEKGVQYVWSNDCESAFEHSKQLLLNNQLLVYFDPTKPIVVACDASPYGVGAVLSHVINGEERPVLFASSSLSSAERNYAQIEREALAIVFAVKRFHKYLYGNTFTLVSDHQPLKVIFGQKKGIPTLAAARIQRWALILSAYDYKIEYRKGVCLGNADALSRLPLKGSTDLVYKIHSFSPVEEVPIAAEEVAKATKHDVILSKVLDLCIRGWPQFIEDINLKPFFSRRHELSVEESCVMWGSRIVIPVKLRPAILRMLHEQHVGIVRTKMLSRSICWWPNMDEDIESLVKNCRVCQLTQNAQKSVCLTSWPTTGNNWYRVHIDFFHKDGYTFLIIVDSKTKWIDVHLMSSTTATATIDKLKHTFAIFGLPVELMSDNGPPFNSNEFIRFCQANGVRPMKSPPYHPQSNGLAERSVQTVKRALERQLFEAKCSKWSLIQQLENFLFSYRNTPSSVTGISPAELMFKQKPRTRLDILKPEFKRKESIVVSNKTGHKRQLYVGGEAVLIRNVKGAKPNWLTGQVVKVLSAVTYLVMVEGQVRVVHGDDMRSTSMIEGCPQGEDRLAVSRHTPTQTLPTYESPQIPITNAGTVSVSTGSDSRYEHTVGRTNTPDNTNASSGNNFTRSPEVHPSPPQPDLPNRSPPLHLQSTPTRIEQEHPALRRSQRTRKAPQRLNL